VIAVCVGSKSTPRHRRCSFLVRLSWQHNCTHTAHNSITTSSLCLTSHIPQITPVRPGPQRRIFAAALLLLLLFLFNWPIFRSLQVRLDIPNSLWEYTRQNWVFSVKIIELHSAITNTMGHLIFWNKWHWHLKLL